MEETVGTPCAELFIKNETESDEEAILSRRDFIAPETMNEVKEEPDIILFGDTPVQSAVRSTVESATVASLSCPPHQCSIYPHSTTVEANFTTLKKNVSIRGSTEKLYKGTACSDSDELNIPLQNRVTTQAVKKAFKCSVCSYSALSKSILLEHEIIHSERNPLINSGYAYSAARTSSHQVNPSGYNPYKCTECPYLTTRISDIRKHRLIHSAEKKFKCFETNCSFSTNSNPKFIQHHRIHTVQKPFECTECPYQTTRKSDLRRHRLIHSAEKKFKCLETNCSFSASSNSKLLLHWKRSHTGEETFKCTECPYSATRKANLTRHLLTHTGEKPFKCLEANCSFSAPSNSKLVLHMRSHTGEKPFKCTECPFTAKSTAKITIHMRCHYNDQLFQCPYCSYSCGRQAHLTLHRRTHLEDI